MSERGATMVSDQDIAEALQSLLREAKPNTSFNDVVQQLELKLGFNLSDKVDFIRTQIHHLLRSQPPPPPPQPPPPQHHHPHKDHFALHQNPNFHPFPFQHPPNFGFRRPEEFGFRPPQPPSQPLPVTKTEAFVTDVSTTSSAVAPAEASKESGQTGKKRRGGPGGLNKLCSVSPLLQVIVGQPEMPRTEIVKQLWAYIKKNNLQDPSNKRKIVCNDELRLVFETDCTDMFKMNKLLAKHITSLEPTKQLGQKSKKLKVDVESGDGSTGTDTIVIISEALANFFGAGGREMLHSEVLKHVWEYIKANQLEDPPNSRMIKCDAKLQELFGCQSIAAMGISDMLAHHHLFKRS